MRVCLEFSHDPKSYSFPDGIKSVTSSNRNVDMIAPMTAHNLLGTTCTCHHVLDAYNNAQLILFLFFTVNTKEAFCRVILQTVTI